MEYMTRNVDANIEIDVHIALFKIIDNHICTNDIDLYDSSDILNSIISNLSHIFCKTDVEELCIICSHSFRIITCSPKYNSKLY